VLQDRRFILAGAAGGGPVTCVAPQIDSVGESVVYPHYHYDGNNVGGTLSPPGAMREARVQRMLFSSTCATYGDTPTPPMDENAEQSPCSPYARTKLAVEWMIRDFARVYGRGYSVRQVQEACQRMVGGAIAYEVVARRPGDAPAPVANPAKLVTALGWKPAYPEIHAIIETAWAWHRRYPGGYADKVGNEITSSA